MPAAPERLQRHLEPGERVLWAGSPSAKWLTPRSTLSIAGPSLLVFVILGGALSLFLVASGEFSDVFGLSSGSSSERVFWIFFLTNLMLVGIAAPALVVLLVSVLNRAQKRKELYAITDRGLLWQRSIWPLSPDRWPVHRFSLEEVNALEVQRHADGTGTITLLDVSVSLDADRSVNPAFSYIPDPDLALAIAYTASEEAGIPPPERPTAWQLMGQAFANWLVAITVGAAGAMLICLGAAILLGLSLEGRGGKLGDLRELLQIATALPAAAAVMFVSGVAGLWSLAVRSRLRRYPHLLRLRRLLAWLRFIMALVWLGTLAWIVMMMASS
jgi:hypothetical protein